MLLRRTIILITLTSLLSIGLRVQSQTPGHNNDTIFNQVDENNQRQGHWKMRYPNGKIAYQGYFVDGKPRGLFRRYHETGVIKARMIFSDCGDSTQTTLYYPSGKRIAEGRHYKKQKDGKWEYYTESQNLALTEMYRHGMRHGQVVTYFPTGEVYERVSWRNDQKHGPTTHFYRNGLIKSSALFEDGQQHGPIKIYYYSGSPRLEGEYKDGLKHGTWTVYTPEGKVISKTEYQQGIADNEEEQLREATRELEEMIRNAGRIQEPTIMDFIDQREY